MEKYIVTSYEHPDLDGISSMYAYSEYLNKTGKESRYYVRENIKTEPHIVCGMFGIELDSVNEIEKDANIVLVDSNNPKLVPFVDVSRIVEVIDHHRLREKLSENVILENEEIGAAATLVADRFRKNNIPISRNSAILLYYGIMSNSFALKSSNTSQRDIEVAKWLEEQCNEISKEKIKEIFRAKSIFKAPLKDEVEAVIPLKCGDIRMTVGQLEIVDAEKFIADNKKELMEVCNYLIDRFKYDCLIINIIDTIGGYSILFSPNENTDKFIKDKFGYEIKNNIYVNSKLVQRKEIIKSLNLMLANKK